NGPTTVRYTLAVFRVLVLDDESMVLEMLAVCLRAPGVQLTTCREIEAAEALLKSSRFDVVIADLSVSDLGGLDGIRLIRFVTTHFPDTVTYVLSGYVDEPVRDLCKMLGVTAVLEKPGGLAGRMPRRKASRWRRRRSRTSSCSPSSCGPIASARCCSRWSSCSRAAHPTSCSASRDWPAVRPPRYSAIRCCSSAMRPTRSCSSRPT